MKIIIVGCGKIGSTLAQELSDSGHDLTVVDLNPDRLSQLTNTLDIYGVQGSAASYQTLLEAGVREADLLVSTVDADEINLLCCLIARQAGTPHVIARVRTPLYVDDIRFYREQMGLSMAISPELVTAQEISRLIRFPSAIKVEAFNKGRVELVELKIPERSGLNGKAVSEAGKLQKSGVLVCMVRRGQEVTIPDGQFVLLSGDRITVIVPPGKSRELLRVMGMEEEPIKSVMLAGGGKISYYLGRILLREGIDVKIIERKPERATQLSELLPGATIILGDCTDKTLLAEEGMEETQGFVSLTDLDEENVMLSLYVGSRSKAKVITKINHVNFDEVIDSLPIGSVIYPKEVVAGLLAQYVRTMQNSMGSNVETLHRLGGGAEALEFFVRANSPLIGKPIQDLNLKRNLLVCSIIRQGKNFVPRGKDALQAGDSVIIVTTQTGLNDLSDILE